MSYRERRRFDQPSPEDLEQYRRQSVWLAPLWVIQLGSTIFRPHADLVAQVMGVVSWAAVSIVLLTLLLAIPLPWMAREHRLAMQDEWSRYVSGEACRWGLATVLLAGIVIMLVRLWQPLDALLVTFTLVNGAMLVAVSRYWWLNRGLTEDE